MVLVAAAVAVLGLGVYLYVAVNSSTAVANVRPRSPEPKPSPEEHAKAEPATPAKTPEGSPSRQGHKFNGAIRDAAAPAVTAETPLERPGANIDIKKDELMATANKAYDHGDFDEAIVVAKKVLSNDPANTRMLRIMVSSSCILDDAPTA